jgi:hypothetical protein
VAFQTDAGRSEIKAENLTPYMQIPQPRKAVNPDLVTVAEALKLDGKVEPRHSTPSERRQNSARVRLQPHQEGRGSDFIADLPLPASQPNDAACPGPTQMADTVAVLHTEGR